ncbi:hypothetical protein [Oleidesulfovibrio sp.]|uniref:hypothetical protein n=1 Tax=Oleidesulfovibrio sp. TaxID=2909707 RepID=UPI003A8B7DAA
MATVCSGIGAPEVAAAPLGWDTVFMSEIEAFPSAVLAHHWPDVPNLGDMTAINGDEWRDNSMAVPVVRWILRRILATNNQVRM